MPHLKIKYTCLICDTTPGQISHAKGHLTSNKHITNKEIFIIKNKIHEEDIKQFEIHNLNNIIPIYSYNKDEEKNIIDDFLKLLN